MHKQQNDVHIMGAVYICRHTTDITGKTVLWAYSEQHEPFRSMGNSHSFGHLLWMGILWFSLACLMKCLHAHSHSRLFLILMSSSESLNTMDWLQKCWQWCLMLFTSPTPLLLSSLATPNSEIWCSVSLLQLYRFKQFPNVFWSCWHLSILDLSTHFID